MVSVKFQIYGSGFNLRLRLYKAGDVRYVSVTKFLRGDFKKSHWSSRKQCFVGNAPMKELNNKILEDIRQPYDELARDWEGSVSGLMIAAKKKPVEEDRSSFYWAFSRFMMEKKMNTHRDGSMKGTYNAYERVVRRLKEYYWEEHQDIKDIKLADMTVDTVNAILDYMEGLHGYGGRYYVSTALKAVFNWCDKMGCFDMYRLRGVRWSKKINESVHKYETLTSEQCKKFIELKKSELPYNIKAPQWAWKSQLYHDFCIFILYTCQSPCDALCLKYDDIQHINGVDHFVFKRRKIAGKQSTACSVPINDIMRRIMKRWKSKAKDGYIFPVRTKETIIRNGMTNRDIEKFNGRVNRWLKKVAPMIGVKFPLHNYVFRHTGITHYISKGVPIIYVANLAGTSVKNCEAIYYNNQCDSTSRDMVLNAIDF